MASQATPLKFKLGTYDKDFFLRKDGHVSEAGTLYFANIPHSPGNMYLYFGDGTNYLNVIPEMLPESNGGVGTNLTQLEPFSVVIQNESASALEGIEPKVGVLKVLTNGTKPQYGLADVSIGGTGRNSLTKNSLLIGNDTSAVNLLSLGSVGQLVGATSSGPAYLDIPVTWSTTNTPSASKVTLNLNIKSGTSTIKAHSAEIPVASETGPGIVTHLSQVFGGNKTFANNVNIRGNLGLDGVLTTTLSEDAYYNSSSDHKEGDIYTQGGITINKNLRVDGGNIQFSKEAKIKYDSTKDSFNFVFV